MTPDTSADGKALADGWGPWRTDVSEWNVSTHDVRFECVGGIHKISTRPRTDLIPSPAANRWRPIETAPRDGTWFRARTEHGTERVVHFADEADRYPISHDGEVWSTAPVEWTPVAPRPAEPAQAAQVEANQRRADAATLLLDMLYMRNGAHEGLDRDAVEKMWNAVREDDGFPSVVQFLSVIAAAQEGRE